MLMDQRGEVKIAVDFVRDFSHSQGQPFVFFNWDSGGVRTQTEDIANATLETRLLVFFNSFRSNSIDDLCKYFISKALPAR